MASFYRYLLIGFFSIVLQYSGGAQSALSIDQSTTYFNKGLQSLTLGDSLTAFQQFEQAYGFSSIAILGATIQVLGEAISDLD